VSTEMSQHSCVAVVVVVILSYCHIAIVAAVLVFRTQAS
jgi:hypothetical protein